MLVWNGLFKVNISLDNLPNTKLVTVRRSLLAI